MALRTLGNKQYLAFLAISLSWSIGLLAAAILAQSLDEDGLVTPLRLLAGIGPLLAAVLLLSFGPSKDRADYLRRLTEIKGIRKSWLAFILIIVPELTAGSIIIDMISGDPEVNWSRPSWKRCPHHSLSLASSSSSFSSVLCRRSWGGGVWLWKAQLVHSPAYTGAIIGIAWIVWHLPLFFIDGTYQEALGLGTPRSIDYLAVIFFQSLIMVWIFNNTSGSIPAAILFHFMVNLVGEMISLTTVSDIILTLLWGVLAITVLLKFRLGGVRDGGAATSVEGTL